MWSIGANIWPVGANIWSIGANNLIVFKHLINLIIFLLGSSVCGDKLNCAITTTEYK